MQSSRDKRGVLKAAMEAVRAAVRTAIVLADSMFNIRGLMREDGAETPHPLAGDRAIEWSWVIVNLPSESSRVLDMGCVGSILSVAAARLGHEVVAVDLREIEYDFPGVTFLKADILQLDLAERSFDVIVSCSMIEHVGLPGRYGPQNPSDGDLLLMKSVGKLLKHGGKLILTIPVGVDGIYPPFHRVYGRQRLKLLLGGYQIIGEEYWQKSDLGRWIRCSKEQALMIQGSTESYALGLYAMELGGMQSEPQEKAGQGAS